MISFDIECVRQESADAYYDSKDYKPAKNLKDPKKIQASIEAKRQTDKDNAVFKWFVSKVICISIVHNGKKRTWSGDHEADVITGLFDYMQGRPGAVLVGKSSHLFDTPFLIGRTLANDIGMPLCLVPEAKPIRDVDHIFSHSSRCSQVSSLADYAHGLGVEGKSNDGSNVALMHERGEWDEIKSYCEQDAMIVYEMIKRYRRRYGN